MNKNRAYIEYKQSLLEEFGVKNTLVPNELIIDLPEFNWERFLTIIETSSKYNNTSDSSLCPYCYEYIMSDCKGCIMREKSVECNDVNSSYGIVLKETRDILEFKKPYRIRSYNLNDIDGFTQKLTDFIKENLITKK